MWYLPVSVLFSAHFLVSFCDDANNSTCFLDDFSIFSSSSDDDDGVSVFQCINNSAVLFGCRAETTTTLNSTAFTNDTVVPNGAAIIASDYLLQCQQVEPHNRTQLIRIGCISPDGHILAPGQTFDVSASGEYYECVADDNNFLEYKKAGCVDENGIKVPLGSFKDDEQFRYVCSKDISTDKFLLKPYGCLHEGGVRAAGESMVRGNYWFQCRLQGDSLTITPAGCVIDGFYVAIGHLYHSKGLWGVCEFVKAKRLGTLLARPVGCLGKSAGGGFFEYDVGRKWIVDEQRESLSKMKQEMQCIQTHDEDGSVGVAVVAVRCVLDIAPADTDESSPTEPKMKFLDENCFTRMNRTFWSCTRTSRRRLTSTYIVHGELKHTMDAILSGLKYCTPKESLGKSRSLF